MYLIRLDDASEYWDKQKWHRMADLLDKYEIKPIFGIIPDNKFELHMKYEKDTDFWDTVDLWIKNRYTPALHSYQHIYCTESGGINPVNFRSEYAGLTFEEQCIKIEKGNEILLNHGIEAEIFFAMAHTFDINTLKALKEKSDIRIISDTVATDVYFENEFHFIPQQTGSVRKLPFKTVTFCYHPNTMTDDTFEKLEKFIIKNKCKFIAYRDINFQKRKLNFIDKFFRFLYFSIRRLKKLR